MPYTASFIQGASYKVADLFQISVEGKVCRHCSMMRRLHQLRQGKGANSPAGSSEGNTNTTKEICKPAFRSCGSPSLHRFIVIFGC
jgi:hypothetical protein